MSIEVKRCITQGHWISSLDTLASASFSSAKGEDEVDKQFAHWTKATGEAMVNCYPEIC